MRSPLYSISIILKIALSVMLVFVVIQLGNTVLSRFRSYLASNEPMDFQVRDLTLEQVIRFSQQFPNEESKTSVQTSLGFFDLNSSMSLRAWLLAGTSEGLDAMEHIAISEGMFPQKKFDIAIEESVNLLLPESCHIGDEITVQLYSGKYNVAPYYTFTICGFLENSGLADISGNETIYAAVSLETAEFIAKEVNLIAPYTINVISNADYNKYNYEQIIIDAEKTLEILYPEYEDLMQAAVTGEISEELSGRLADINSILTFNHEKENIYNDQAGYDQFDLTMHVVAFFIATASVLLLFNSMNINYSRQIKQWGSMRALGLSRKQFSAVLIIEGFIYFLSGSILGLAIGSILTQLTGGQIASALIKTKVYAVLSFHGYLIAVAISAIAIIISTLILYRQAASLSPIEMMNYNENNMKGEQKVISKFQFNGNNPILFIGARQIFRRKTAVYTVGGILILCNVLFATLANTFFSLEWPKGDPKSEVADFEIIQDWLTDFYPQFDNQVLAEIRNVAAVEHIYAMGNSINYQIKNYATGEYIGISVYNNDLFTLFCQSAGIPLENLQEPKAISIGDIRADNPLEIGAVLMEDLGKAHPDIIYDGEIIISSYYEDEFYQNGGNIRESNNGINLIINEVYAEQIFGTAYYNDIFFETDMDSAELIPLINPIFEQFRDYRYVSFKVSLSPDMMQLLAILVITLLLSIYVTIILLQLEIGAVKTNLTMYIKEYSIHRALGATLTVVRRIICFEALAVSAVAGLISIFLSLLFNIAVTNLAFNTTKISIPTLLIVPAANVVSYVFIFWQVSAKLGRSTISDSIRNND